ncbi:MAG: DUF1553 domain-containing protein, partial [Verrucomicrobiales bacterium]|nr:DUF1553 domain-containing protein [Verrucomicrobiales bacterium]
QQALYVLNAPFVQVQALALARLPEVVAADGDRVRVAALFRRVLGRDPNETEWNAAAAFLDGARRAGEGANGGEWDATAQLAQALLVSNEAVFAE